MLNLSPFAMLNGAQNLINYIHLITFLQVFEKNILRPDIL